MLHAGAVMPNVCHVLCSAIFEHEPAAAAALAAKFMIAFTRRRKRKDDVEGQRASHRGGEKNRTGNGSGFSTINIYQFKSLLDGMMLNC